MRSCVCTYTSISHLLYTKKSKEESKCSQMHMYLLAELAHPKSNKFLFNGISKIMQHIEFYSIF